VGAQLGAQSIYVGSPADCAEMPAADWAPYHDMYGMGAESALEAIRRVLIEGGSVPPYRLITRDGRVIWLQSYVRIRRDERGIPLTLYGVTLDLTVFKEAEARVAELLDRSRQAGEERERLLARLEQEARRVADLSTPLMPLGEDVLVMPLVGSVDAGRARPAGGTRARQCKPRTSLAGVDCARSRHGRREIGGRSEPRALEVPLSGRTPSAQAPPGVPPRSHPGLFAPPRSRTGLSPAATANPTSGARSRGRPPGAIRTAPAVPHCVAP
jgi:hypothetical protein